MAWPTNAAALLAQVYRRLTRVDEELGLSALPPGEIEHMAGIARDAARALRQGICPHGGPPGPSDPAARACWALTRAAYFAALDVQMELEEALEVEGVDQRVARLGGARAAAAIASDIAEALGYPSARDYREAASDAIEEGDPYRAPEAELFCARYCEEVSNGANQD